MYFFGSIRDLRFAGLLPGVAQAGGDDHAPASGGGDGDAFEHPLFPWGNDHLQIVRHFAVEVVGRGAVERVIDPAARERRADREAETSPFERLFADAVGLRNLIGCPFGVEPRKVCRKALPGELLPRLARHGRPCDLGEGVDARQQLVLDPLPGRHEFRPKVGLHAQQVLLFLFGEPLRRVVAVYLLQRQGEVQAYGLVGRIRPPFVEIEVLAGGHHHMVVLSGRRDAALCAPPAHDDRPGRQPALHDLVPADQLPAFRREVAVDAVGEVGLQLRLVAQPLGRDTGLAVGAGFPAGVLALVAADVDQLRGKERDDLVEHVFEEFEGALLARAEDVAGAADPTRYFVGFGVVHAPQPGVGREGCERVPGHFDFGDDRDVPLGGIGDDLADLVLRVKAAVSSEFEGGGLLFVAADLGFRTPRPDFGQAR